MKYLSVVLAAALLSACDGIPTPLNISSELMQVDHEYEIDTFGFNSEVYEFTPKSNESKSCVFLMLDNGKAMGLQCFDKN